MSIYNNKSDAKQIFRFLNGPNFQGLNRLFVLSFENEDGRGSHKQYYLSSVETNDHNVIMDGRNLFDQSIKMI